MRTEPIATPQSTAELDTKLLLDVLLAIRRGDFSARMPTDLTGVAGKIADTINDIASMQQDFAGELERVSVEVGKEGRTGQRVDLPGAARGWSTNVAAVNALIEDLSQPTLETARVIGAVARGDLTQMMALEVEGRPLHGDFLRTAKVVNGMVDQLGSFASEVTRVAREVGTEGKLGGQARVNDVAGTWKDLTESVNSMASNLTAQVRNIAEVTTAVANGDLSKKITVDVRGEILQLKETINTMVDQLRTFSLEVTRVAREVGTDGKLGGQAVVLGVGGTWKDLTDSVNSMASNLTAQVRNIAEVTTAVARGDLTRKITVDVRGEILELKNTINTMVDQLRAFSSEVTRVAREVGTEGKLGGQAEVPGAGGTWKDLTDSVNQMASNLTAQVRNIAEVTTAVANGDLSKTITVDVKGEILELKNTINTMVDQLNAFASEVTRVAREVGTEGKLGGQAAVKGVAGTWKDLTDSVNQMASNLTAQVRNIAEVTTAVANGDLSKKITVDVSGEILALKKTINTMVDQLSSFAAEVTRVAREVGTEGKLGGQADVKGVAGTWKDLTENVNLMGSNLTGQVRNIAQVTTAVANGDLSKKITVDVEGEILELKVTINTMVDQLSSFASEVTRVAREVGTEGKLGGQAVVHGAAGIWRDLTDNVNQLAGNLTTQVRAIAEVSTAVAQGDLTRSIAVEAAGEVAALKDNINRMIRNLQETTRRNTDQDWLKTNLAKLTRVLQGQRDLMAVSRSLLSEVAPLVGAQLGAFYLAEAETSSDGKPSAETTHYKLLGGYAYRERKGLSNEFRLGEGLVGQCALEKERILVSDLPDDYVRISSGLGETKPRHVVVQPVISEGDVKAVVELASVSRFTDIQLAFLDQLAESIGIVLTTIVATMRTEELLKQSQALTGELQSQQEELTEKNKRLEDQARTLRESEELLRTQQADLKRANEELEDRAHLLSQQKAEVEQKNREVESARSALEEKAGQLALTSRYKSEFLANMSHELRTPLNSMLLLSRMLEENDAGNLSPAQIEYAQTIHSAGEDLLLLINDVLDLAKIESGSMEVERDDVPMAQVVGFCESSFRHVAEQKGLAFTVTVEREVPELIDTDRRRLQQVLKNLLANAFKFTDRGSVTLVVRSAIDVPPRFSGKRMVAFDVTDTGIGIPRDKHEIIFEAFQQADGSTNRRYGGTGLGLSISREIARALGGELRVTSEAGRGSTFTLLLPAGGMEEQTRAGEQAASDVRTPSTEPAPDTPSPAPSMTSSSRRRHDPILGGKKVLIVDDDARNIFAIRSVLEQHGLRVVTADNGRTGIDTLERTPDVDVVLMDVMMPEMDGFEAMRVLRGRPAYAKLPIIAVTAKAMKSDRLKCIESGASDYVSKPVDVDQLLSLLRVWVTR